MKKNQRRIQISFFKPYPQPYCTLVTDHQIIFRMQLENGSRRLLLQNAGTSTVAQESTINKIWIQDFFKGAPAPYPFLEIYFDSGSCFFTLYGQRSRKKRYFFSGQEITPPPPAPLPLLVAGPLKKSFLWLPLIRHAIRARKVKQINRIL